MVNDRGVHLRMLTPDTRHELPVAVELRVLGPLEAIVGGRPAELGAPKQRALLALLVSRVGQPLTVDTILDELWAGHPPPSATTSLQAYVANLRKALEPDRAPRTPPTVLCTSGQGYLLDSSAVEVDAHRFDEHSKAGRQAWDRGDPRRTLTEFEAGLALWRGEAYSEVAGALCVSPEISRLEQLRLSVIEGRCAALLAVGAHEIAVPELESFTQAHPLREYGCELLSLALYRAGRQADALAVLRTNQKRLAEELGIDPRPALKRLEHDILSHAPALDWHRAPAIPATAEPRGSTVPERVRMTEPQPPPVADTEVFVGREVALRQLADSLAASSAGQGRVVTVSGEPGSGKTSLLRRFTELAGVPVLWGTSPEHVATAPLWPWGQVLRALGTRSPQLSVPGPVAELLAGDAQPAADDAAATLRRFEAIVHYLTDASQSTPIVVVLDRLHRADLDSLRLLAHLAERVPASRLMVVVSYQPGEAAPLAGTLAALARAGTTRIELNGLTIQETRTLANAMSHRETRTSTAEELCARTEGNPFYLRELIKLLTREECLERPSAAPAPAPVREVVLQRVAQLSQTAAQVLTVAAIEGRHFDIEVVAEAASIEIDAALEALDTAVTAGLIVEDQQHLGWFRFAHALTAEALRETTGRFRRARLRERIDTAAARGGMGTSGRVAEGARLRVVGA